MKKALSLRHEALLPAYRKFERALIKARLYEREADQLFEQYPAPAHTHLHAGRMRATNLHNMATDGINAAHAEFRLAVRQIGSPAAVCEFVPPLAYRVVLPHYKQTKEVELITFGAIPTGAPVSHAHQLALARAQIATWSPRVKAELLGVIEL